VWNLDSASGFLLRYWHYRCSYSFFNMFDTVVVFIF
jgi:hypothetical protein